MESEVTEPGAKRLFDADTLSGNAGSIPQTEAEKLDEAKKIRRLQMMMHMVMSVIGQDTTLTVDEAAELAGNSKRAALAMFPDKEHVFDLIYRPRLQRLMRERFHLQ
jgi:hypothetical protein